MIYTVATILAFALLNQSVQSFKHASSPPNGPSTALDEYVWKPDSNYKWVDMGDQYKMEGKGFIHRDKKWTGYLLNVTSQAWLTPEAFANTSDSGSIWWHMLAVIVPEEVKYKTNGSMYITGWSMPKQGADGKWSSIPTAKDEDIKVAAALAVETGVITGCLFQVPDEKVIFADDPKQQSRGEDAIIAYTWAKFLKDPSKPEWLLRFPMVKAGVRAMDAMTEFVATKLPELDAKLDYYTVAGASKRGWTTWDLGAVDPTRVRAIVPIVLDAINFVPVMHHQYMSYNGWSWALQDYLEENIFTQLDTPNMKLLAQNVDPYYYRNRLTMPKLVVNAALDEFQQPDDTRYWWDEMPGPKHFIMTPNAEHSEATGIFEIVPAISAWVQKQLDKEPVPEFTWKIDDVTGEIVATLPVDTLVKEARVWWAYSCGNNPDGKKRRDFRIINLDDPCKCGIRAQGKCMDLKSFWSHKKLDEETVAGQKTFRAKMDAPDDGRWVAFFIDIVLAKDKKDAHRKWDMKMPDFIPHDLAQRVQFTTEVSVFPNTFPYPDCGIDANGKDTGNPCVETMR